MFVVSAFRTGTVVSKGNLGEDFTHRVLFHWVFTGRANMMMPKPHGILRGGDTS
jgi:hypothetical protein